MCSVFWLFWLSCQYLLSDWLERLLKKHNRGVASVSTKPRLKTYGFLVYCIVSLFNHVFVMIRGHT